MPAVGTGTGSSETGSETCAMAFPFRVLHSHGTPGIVQPVARHGMALVLFDGET